MKGKAKDVIVGTSSVIAAAGALLTFSFLTTLCEHKMKESYQKESAEDRKKDAEKYAALKSTVTDTEALEICEKSALSDKEDQFMDRRCSDMRDSLENYRMFSRQISKDAKPKDARKAARRTVNGFQMRVKNKVRI